MLQKINEFVEVSLADFGAFQVAIQQVDSEAQDGTAVKVAFVHDFIEAVKHGW